MDLANLAMASRPATWLIKHVVSPLQMRLFILTNGRVSLTGTAPVLLLTTTGRKSGKPRTVPLFYLADGQGLIVCNVRPPSERPNPWPMNMRANPHGRVSLGRNAFDVEGRAATSAEVETYWPGLVRIWPAYATFFKETGQRSIFVLVPTNQRSRPEAKEIESIEG